MSHVLTVIAAPRTSTTVASPLGEDLARRLVSALEDAGLGVGFYPKEIVKSEADVCITAGDLTALLYLPRL